jgi:hypothetical protein
MAQYLKIIRKNIMKTRIFLVLIALFTLQMPACLPVDDTIDPGDPVAKFLGDWKVNESCQRGNYNVTIDVDPGNSSQVLLDNFGNPGPDYDVAVGLVVSNDIYVSSQTIGEGWTVSGKGTYQSDGTILWDYTLIIAMNEQNCTAVYSK